MPHVMNPPKASESSRPHFRLGGSGRKYRVLSALSEKFFLCKNLSARASESAYSCVVPSEISESGIMVLYRGILMFLIICLLSNLRRLAHNDQALPHPRPQMIRRGGGGGMAAPGKAQLHPLGPPP